MATIEPAEIGFAGPADQQTEPEQIITMTPPGRMNGAKCRALQGAEDKSPSRVTDQSSGAVSGAGTRWVRKAQVFTKPFRVGECTRRVRAA